MFIPHYRWICHKCGGENAPGLGSCAVCGFGAVASAVEIAQAKSEPDPVAEGYRSLGRGVAWLAILWPWGW